MIDYTLINQIPCRGVSGRGILNWNVAAQIIGLLCLSHPLHHTHTHMHKVQEHLVNSMMLLPPVLQLISSASSTLFSNTPDRLLPQSLCTDFYSGWKSVWRALPLFPQLSPAWWVFPSVCLWWIPVSQYLTYLRHSVPEFSFLHIHPLSTGMSPLFTSIHLVILFFFFLNVEPCRWLEPYLWFGSKINLSFLILLITVYTYLYCNHLILHFILLRSKSNY